MTTVKYNPNLAQKPQLSAEQEVYLAHLSDQEIDYSDIEDLDEAFWEKAEIVSPDLLSTSHASDTGTNHTLVEINSNSFK